MNSFYELFFSTFFIKTQIDREMMAAGGDGSGGGAPNTKEMELITDGLPEGVSVRGLEDAIVAYQMLPPTSAPITLQTLPIVLGTPEHQESTDDNDADAIIAEQDDELAEEDGGVGSAQASLSSDNYAAELYQLEPLQDCGKLLKTIGPVALSEEESEYNVQCLKHIFPNGCMVLQFNVVNTIDSQLLRECKVELEFEEPDHWDVVATIPAPTVTYSQPGKTYVRCQANNDEIGLECYQSSAITAELQFFQCECDPSTGEILDEEDEGMDDQYPVESIEISPADFISKTIVSNFRESWKEMGNVSDVLKIIVLSLPSNIFIIVKSYIYFFSSWTLFFLLFYKHTQVEERVETFELDTFNDIQSAVRDINLFYFFKFL